jgi:hypothetical protein
MDSGAAADRPRRSAAYPSLLALRRAGRDPVEQLHDDAITLLLAGADLEGVLVRATLARRWRLESTAGVGEADARITLRPRGPVPMRLVGRGA